MGTLVHTVFLVFQRCTVYKEVHRSAQCTQCAHIILNVVCLCTLVNIVLSEQWMFASVHIKFWSFRAPGGPVCMCRYGSMEGAIKNWTLPRIYYSDGGLGTKFTGPDKLFFVCSNFHFRCEVLSCTSRSTGQEYPNCLEHSAKWSPRRILQAWLESGEIGTLLLPRWCV